MNDHVVACATTLLPLYELIKAHVFAAERIHGDDTTVPVLAKVKTRTGRIWTYVRDDRPFGGQAPPAAMLFYSPHRASTQPEQHLAGYCWILEAYAYAGFNTLYAPDRVASEAVRNMDAIFALERSINGRGRASHGHRDPQAWLADVLGRINDHTVHRRDELLPWNWAAGTERRKVAA
jgi:transposase IS66 family protein/transposase IS66-like protein